MNDPFLLQRFVDAQAPVFDDAVAQLRAGRKTSHWMWFIFPQLASLGRSATARRFGLRSVEEARAYWAHPLLGPRLKVCCDVLLGLDEADPHRIFGSPDDLKLCSCLTLFERAAPAEPVFARLLERCYAGRRDALTLQSLSPS